MKKTAISLWFLLACCAWTARAEEILYVHNSQSGEITMISIPGHEIIGQIKIGQWMDYLAASPDGRILYVNRINTFGNVPDRPNIGASGELIAVSTANNEILWRVQLDGMPNHHSVSKDGRYVFVPYYDTWWLAVVDTEKRAVVKKIYIGHGGHGTKLSHDGKRLYVGSMMYHYLAIIDIEKLEMIDRIPFTDGVRPFVFTRDEKLLYVQLSRMHGFVVVDFPTKRQIKTVELPKLSAEAKIPQFYPHTVNHGIALTPDEKLLFANGSVMNYVCVYSHPELKLIKTIPVGTDPNYVLFSKDGRFAYISNRQSNDLSIIDVGKLQEVKRLKLGSYPQRMVIINVPERKKEAG
jgi:YVTN family beta-propeller protein